MDKTNTETSTALPTPPPERRMVVSGRIDREQIRLVIATTFEHSYAYEWQNEVANG